MDAEGTTADGRGPVLSPEERALNWRLNVERFAPVVQVPAERASRARHEGPTAQWALALLQQEIETIDLEVYRQRRTDRSVEPRSKAK